MSNGEEQLKKELLEELGSENTDAEKLSGLFKAEETPILGEDLTAEIMQRINTTRRPSPILKISRIALPITACAAALVICISPGVGHFGPQLGLDTVEAESGYGYTTDASHLKESADKGYADPESPMAPPAAPEGTDDALNGTVAEVEVYVTSDSLEEVVEETEESVEADMELPEAEAPASTSGTSASPSTEKAYGTDYENYVFTLNSTAALSNAATFSANLSAEGTQEEPEAEIILLMASNYAEYSLFGNEYTEEDTGVTYELITVNCAVDRETFLNEMEEYVTYLSTEMSNAFKGDDWSIEIKDVTSLPDALTPDAQVKIIKEQETE